MLPNYDLYGALLQSRVIVMTRSFKILVVFPVACAGILWAGAGLAASDSVPKYNAAVSCESPGRKSMHIGNSNRSVEACKKSEHEAHQELLKTWSKYSATDRKNCHSKVNSGGPPSYIELHSCLETMRHAHEIREGHHQKKT
jgi:hypothetical protein